MIPSKYILLAASFAVLAGCGQPAISLKAPAFQSSENTVRDWNDVAHEINNEMGKRGLIPFYLNGQPQFTAGATYLPVFIRVQGPDSTFLNQVAGELEHDILQAGGMISRRPDGATIVNLDVNFVKWGPRDKPPGLLGTTAAVAAIPGLVISASRPMSLWTSVDAAAATAGGVGILFDGLTAMTPATNSEAVWEASIMTDDRVVMRIREPVYIRSADIPFYMKTTDIGPAPSWKALAASRPRMIGYSQ